MEQLWLSPLVLRVLVFSLHKKMGKKSEKAMGPPSARLPLSRTGLFSGFSLDIQGRREVRDVD